MLIYYLSLIDDPQEKDKFEILYRTYHDLMFYAAYQVLENQRDAEDAVHDACLRIIDVLHCISDPVCPKTRSLILTVVKGKAIDLYRARKCRTADSLDELDVPSYTALESTMIASNSLMQAVRLLPPRQRDLLLLKFDQGFETWEIAKMMNMSKAAAEKAIQRARENLRKKLNEQGVIV